MNFDLLPRYYHHYFFFIVYVLVGGFFLFRMVPRLSPAARRLAVILLAMQALVVASGLETFAWECCGEWPHWHLTWEYGIPERMSGAILALIGSLALLNAWHSSQLPAWHRSYFVGIGALFLFLGLDETSYLHEQNEAVYRLLYTLLGAAAVAATLYIIRHDRMRSARWYLQLLVGLAVMALGGMVVDQLGYANLALVLPGFEKLHARALEEMLEHFSQWLVLLAVLGLLDSNSLAPGSWVRKLLNTLSALAAVLLLALLLRNPYLRDFTSDLARDLGGSLEYMLLTEKQSLVIEGDITMAAFRLQRRADGISFKPLLTSPNGRVFNELGFSLHLVDQVTGNSAAGTDKLLDRNASWRWLFGDSPALQGFIYGTWAELDLPADLPRNRAYWIVLTFWRELDDTYIRTNIRSSDLPLLGESQIILDEFALPAAASLADSAPLARFDNGLILQKYDDITSASPGEIFGIRFYWRSETADHDDYIQFLHLRHDDSGYRWGFDQPPLGARLPTRLWIKGLADSETWHIPLPDDLPPGRYSLFTGLYRADDTQRLPGRDATGAPLIDHILLLGSLTLE